MVVKKISEGTRVKKILSLLLIIIALLLVGCAPVDSPKTDAQRLPVVELVESLNGEAGSKTVFEMNLSGGVEKNFGYTVERTQEGYNLTVKDGNSGSYQVAKIEDGTKEYKNLCEGNAPQYEGNLKDIVYLPACKLFRFDGAIRTVKVEDLNDGTTVYRPEIYEGKVKDAFICFKNIFLETEDVLNMSLVLEEAGTKATITVEMTAKYAENQTPVQVKLTVIHTKTVKVID